MLTRYDRNVIILSIESRQFRGSFFSVTRKKSILLRPFVRQRAVTVLNAFRREDLRAPRVKQKYTPVVTNDNGIV